MRVSMLLGLGADASIAKIEGFLVRSPNPDSTQVGDFLKLYTEPQRTQMAQALVAKGVSATAVSNALNFLNAAGKWNTNTLWGIATVVSAAASGYHGFKRHSGSIGWGALWFVLGGIFPVFTPVIAFAQGYGKAK